MTRPRIEGESVRRPVRGSWPRKLLLLVACGLIEAALCFAFIRSDSETVALPSLAASALSERPFRPNETGVVTARCLDPDADDKPTLQVRWRNLRIENGRIGVLNTPLCKTVTVEGLEIKSYRHSDAGTPEGDVPILGQTLRDLERRLKADYGSMEIRSPLLDVRNATKVIIRGLDYARFRDDRQELGVKCRYAAITSSALQVVLRGGVTIRVEDGGALLSNCVVWDVQKSRFYVPDVYCLNRGAAQISGRRVECDQRLCRLTEHEPPGGKGAKTWAEDVSF